MSGTVLAFDTLAAVADANCSTALVLPAGHTTGLYVVRLDSNTLRLTVA